ncbi:hypothetical protein AB3R30_01280 [Leptolyngbyaceae cyanobacterium UHCC 1019]
MEDSTIIAIYKKGEQHYYLKLPKTAPDATPEKIPSFNFRPARSPRIYQA